MGSRGNVDPGFKGDMGVFELYGISGAPVSMLLVVANNGGLRWCMTSRSMWSLGSRCSLENLMGVGVWGSRGVLDGWGVSRIKGSGVQEYVGSITCGLQVCVWYLGVCGV